MPLVEKPSRRSSVWFWVGILGLFGLSLALRFWGLERFNTLVFDEVYYVKFAHNYLTRTPFFDGHPPLSKYLIAIAMWLGNQLPIGRDSVNALAGAEYSTWSYRWLNALTGSLIPLVVAGIAYQLSHRHRYALIAGSFAALDGLFLVESRYALNNVYLIIFGLLGLWCLLLALNSSHSWQRDGWLAIAGIGFGASIAIKWNGLWFLLGAYGLWVAAWFIDWIQSIVPGKGELFPTDPGFQSDRGITSPLQRLTRLRWWQVGLNFAVIPALFYYLSWIPHLQFNTTDSFWSLQQQILSYHERVGSGPTVHPYCSTWFTWLLMLRPVAYFYQITNKGDPLPSGPSALTATPDRLIYDVHAIGNPMLWWFSTLAIILVLVGLGQCVFQWATATHRVEDNTEAALSPPKLALSSTELWLGLFLVVNYAANLLPWVRVTRCIFLYHYMGASVFASLAIAWLVDRWLQSNQSNRRTMAIAVILLILLAFIFWLPIYLGLPLSPSGFQWRIWLPTWV